MNLAREERGVPLAQAREGIDVYGMAIRKEKAVRNKLCIIVLMSSQVLLAPGQGKEPEADLSLSARAALQEMDRTIQIAKQKAVEKLKLAMKNEMQMGKLDRANRINQEILRITGETETKTVGDPKSLIAGEWQMRNGVLIVFDDNFDARIPQNGYSGAWKLENKKVSVLLNIQNGKQVAATYQYSYHLPTQREKDKRLVYVMEAEAGYDNVTTLFKKE